jgi:ketosteroid isomerase-like protein
MDTPSAVQAFFAAEDLERVVSAFTPDAVVKDEGNTYRGRQAIRRVAGCRQTKYRYVAEPIETITQERQGKGARQRQRKFSRKPGHPAIYFA